MYTGYIHVHAPNALFSHISHLFFSGRGSFLALSAARHTGSPYVHYVGSSLGSGRPPWRALWVFNVAPSGKLSLDRFSAELREPRRTTESPPTKKNQKQFLAYSLLSVTARTSPGRLATSHPKRGRLTTWPPRPSSSATTVTLRARFFVPGCCCMYSRMINREKISQNKGASGSASGILPWIH